MEFNIFIFHDLADTLSKLEFIVKYLPSATPIIASLAAWFAYSSYQRQRRLHQEKLSYDFVHFYQNDSELTKHRNNLNTLFKKFKRENIDVAEFAKLNSENEYGKSIMAILNTWERCAHSIREELIDEEYLYNIFHVVALKAYDTLQGYIDYRRSLNGNSTAYLNFRWMAERWKLRVYIDPPKEEFIELKKIITKSSDFTWALSKNYRNKNSTTSKREMKKLYKQLTEANKRKGRLNWIKYISLQK